MSTNKSPNFTPIQYLSIQEVADMLAISPSTVRNLVQHQQLPAIRTGTKSKTVRIAYTDLTDYLAAHRTMPMPSPDPAESKEGPA